MRREDCCLYYSANEYRQLPASCIGPPGALNMRHRFKIAGLLCICMAASASGQAPPTKSLTQVRTADPFKIESGSLFSASASPQQSSNGAGFAAAGMSRAAADFEEALELIRSNHVDARTIETSELSRSAIVGMLRTLDPHSNYYDAREYHEMLDEQRSEYSGIGATIANYNRDGQMGTYILATTPGGPAARAGLIYGDRIAAVNGETMDGLTSDVVRDKVRGPGGTAVRLTIAHAAAGSTSVIELRRGRLYQASLPDAYILGRGVGYVDLTNGFNFTTSDELDAAIKSLKRQGAASLVIDLRGNPGGVLDQAVKVAEKFLPAGSVVVSQRGRSRIDNRVWRSTNKTPETMPLVLLVDEYSASASEVVAGALQDHDRALIVGERTFGKGLVQTVVDLPSGAGLTITTARYFTPSGRSIQRDYSSGSIYDYYNHKGGPAPADLEKVRTTTDSKRPVFGGDGIAPDETKKADRLTPFQTSLIDQLFQFSVTAGGSPLALAGRSKAEAMTFVDAVDTSESRETVASFVKFVLNDPEFAGKTDLLDAEQNFIRTRLQYNLAMRSGGAAAAARVLISNDPQVAAAVSFLPRAAQMARAAVNFRASK